MDRKAWLGSLGVLVLFLAARGREVRVERREVHVIAR